MKAGMVTTYKLMTMLGLKKVKSAVACGSLIFLASCCQPVHADRSNDILPLKPQSTQADPLNVKPQTKKKMKVALNAPGLKFARDVLTKTNLKQKPVRHQQSEAQTKHEKDIHQLAGVYTPYVRKAAEKTGLSPRLIASVIYVESRSTISTGRMAKSHDGAIGPMQLLPKTARRELHVNPWNRAENIYGGAKYLKQLVDHYHNVRLALMAYNVGPTSVDRGSNLGVANDYADKVLSYDNG